MEITIRAKSTTFAARTTFVAVLMLCALAAAGPGAARAATYSVYSCVGPSSEPLPNYAWLTSVNTPAQTSAFSFGPNCGDLSVLASTTTDFAFGDGAEYVFDPPTGTTVSGYQLTNGAEVSYPGSGPTPPTLSADVGETTNSVTGVFACPLVTTNCNVPPAAATRAGLALTKLSVGVQCATSPGGCAANSFTKLSTQLINARVDVEDPTAPVIVSIGGSLPGSNASAAGQTLHVAAMDVGGGVRMINFAIDGAVNQSSSAGGSCSEPYTFRAPCPSALVRTLNVNTAGLTTGVHTGSLTATDAAGATSAPYTFTFSVASGGASPGGGGMAPSNGSPAVEQPIVKTGKSVISPKNGRTAFVEGTLTTAAGVPVAGAVLDVTSLDLGVFDAAPKSIGTIATNAAGRFSIRVKPNGAQRISILFRPYPASIGTAVTSSIVREDLSLSVTRSKLRVKPGGLLTLTGALDGAGAAADGAPVEIDARIGKSWRAVGVVESNLRGSYKWRYRFTRVEQPTRFTFRVLVRKNKSWPWPTVTSRPVKVLVAQ